MLSSHESRVFFFCVIVSPRRSLGRLKKAADEESGKGEDIELLLPARHVVLATGGFAADRGSVSYPAENAPQYLEMPATVGTFSTGDGNRMATSIGAGKNDMEKIQIHPTDFVDPADPLNPSKILCAEVMRGVGGILLNDKGQRFCNELATRDYGWANVSANWFCPFLLSCHQKQYAHGPPTFLHCLVC
jgi:hypothetical protein